jgi:hypothetical protein
MISASLNDFPGPTGPELTTRTGTRDVVPELSFKKPTTLQDCAVRLIEFGYYVVPIPGGHKGPVIEGWQNLLITPDQVPLYWNQPGMLIGCLHKNLACFDIDVYDEELTARILAEGFRRFPYALERVGEPPKSSIVLRVEEPAFRIRATEKHSIETDDGEIITAQVDVRTDTRQMVVYGKHPATGKPYTWPRGELWATPLNALPIVTAQEAQSFRDWCNDTIRQWAGVQSPSVVSLSSFRGSLSNTNDRPSEAAFLKALGHVPASLGHDDGWLQCLMGIHDFYNGSPQGLTVAQSWSSADPRYSPQEVETKWRSFEVGEGQTYKTVLHFAKLNGCNMSELWRMDHPPRVAALDDLAEDFQRIETPQAPTKPDADEPKNDLTDWVFLSADNEFYNRFTGERMTVSAFNLAMGPITPAIEYDKPNGETASRKFPPSKTLVDHLGGKVVANTMYRPDQDDMFFWVDGIQYVNSYLPHTVPETDDIWEFSDAWVICRNHIRNILGSDSEIIISWMAHNVQKPGRKILWSPIIVGVQGDGKTTISKMLQAAMGRANVGPVSPEAMFSDFTGWAEGSCVRVLEEIRIHGNSRHNAMNKLKPLITNDSVEIVRKGRDGKQIANVTNYMALTNHMDALALDEGDRRWGVFKTRFQTRQDMLAELDDAYWQRLHTAIDKHPGTIRGWLLSIDLNGFNRVVGPETTDHKRAMIEAARSPAEGDVCEVLALGGFGIAPNVVATDCLNDAIKGQGGRTLNTSVLANILRDLGWERFDGTVKWKGKNRRVYYRAQDNIKGRTGADLVRVLRNELDLTDEGTGF